MNSKSACETHTHRETHCVICGAPLRGKQRKFCSQKCSAAAREKNDALAEQIWEYKRQNISMRVMAERLGLTPGQVANFIYGRANSPWAIRGAAYREKRKYQRVEGAGKVIAHKPERFAEPKKPLPPAPLHPKARRWVKCAHGAGDVWEQCPEWAMPGHTLCVRHYRRLKRE